MKLSGSICGEMVPSLWQDPQGKGVDFLEYLFITLKHSKNCIEREQSMATMRAHQVSNAIGNGFTVLKWGAKEEKIQFANKALQLLEYWTAECNECRSDIVLSGALIQHIVPCAGSTAFLDEDSTVALNLLKFLHHFFDGNKYFNTAVLAKESENILEIWF